MKKMLLMWLCCLPLSVMAETFVAGQDYAVLDNTPQTTTKQLTEFFSYGCPWCYRLEPQLEAWLTANPKINFKRVPVSFHPEWQFYAKAYLLAHALHLEKTLTPIFFEAIIKQRQSLASNQAMIEFFKKQHVDSALVESAFEHSLNMDMQITEANELMQSYHVVGIPAFVINQHYKTDLQMAKTPERLFLIINYLLSH